MAGKYEIIARYTDGIAHFMLGKKIDPEKALEEGNVKWMEAGGKPLIFERYKDAEDCLKQKKQTA